MNLFGQPKATKRSQLAALMQPSLMEMLLPEQDAAPQQQTSPVDLSAYGGKPAQLPNVQNPYKGPVLPPSGFTASPGQQRNASEMLKELSASAGAGIGAGINRMNQGALRMEEGPKEAPKTVNAPPAADEFVGPLQEEPAPEVDRTAGLLGSDESKRKSLDMIGGVGSLSNALGGIEDLARAAYQMKKGEVDRQSKFEATPELDDLIAKTHADLDTARGERKKPGLGEFLVLALMNLANKDYRNNADMILGRGEQMQREGMLENRLANLEGNRAQTKAMGRHELRTTDQGNRRFQLEQALKAQDAQRKQSNWEREFSQKDQQNSSGLLRALAGQEANVIQSSMDKDAVKKAAASREKLKKMLGLDDAGLDRMIQQQRQQQQPQDDRQGRLFGDVMAGGGYA